MYYLFILYNVRIQLFNNILHYILFIMSGHTYDGYWPGFKGVILKISEALKMCAQSNCSNFDEWILKYAYALLPFRSRPRMRASAERTLWCYSHFSQQLFLHIHIISIKSYNKSPAWAVNVLKHRSLSARARFYASQ